MSGREPGYRPQRKLYKLVFDDHPGLVVRARSASAGVFLEIATLKDGAEKDSENIVKLYTEFARVLVSWNLEYGEDDGPELEGQPVPTTFDGLMSQDTELVDTIVVGWMSAVAGVPAPLAQPSNGGSVSLVESLPMEPLSVSRVS